MAPSRKDIVEKLASLARQKLPMIGAGAGLEVEMIARAHELDLLTTPYVFNPSEAEAMTSAGADVIVAHMGVTVGGAIGATSARTLAQCVGDVDRIADAAMPIRSDILVLCHGGPIATPEDAEFMMRNCRCCQGFYGASSMERLPVETALTERVRRFKALSF